MLSVFDFLRDPQNRAMLSWIGGGLSGLFGGILAIRRLKLAPASETPNVKNVSSDIITDRNAVVITRGGEARDVRIGYGLISIFLLGLIMLSIGLAATIFSGSLKTSSSVLPKFDFEISCSFQGDSFSKTPFKASAKEEGNFDKLTDFAQQNDGKLVYLTLNIVRTCDACKCYRAEYTKHEFLTQDAEFDGIYIASKGHDLGDESNGAFVWPQDIELNFSDLDTHAFPWQVFFPKADQIPSSGLYSINQYGSYMFYQGPFVVHFDEGTGYGYAYFSPVADNSATLENRIDCTLKASNMTFSDKVRAKCL